MDEIMHAIAILENVEFQENAQNRRKFYKRQDAFSLSDKDFVRNFRLSKILVNQLITMVTPFMTEPSRSSALDITTKVSCEPNYFLYLYIYYIVIL